MNTESTLTPDQLADWKYYVQWYAENGWEGDEGRQRAWQDLCRKYPELEHSGIPNLSPTA